VLAAVKPGGEGHRVQSRTCGFQICLLRYPAESGQVTDQVRIQNWTIQIGIIWGHGTGARRIRFGSGRAGLQPVAEEPRLVTPADCAGMTSIWLDLCNAH
jgi:hypothetical protein